jgi:threonine aldolase
MSRLKLDHANAKVIAEACSAISPSLIDSTSVETNIVALNLSGTSITANELNNQLKEAGILAAALGPKFLRIVTHLDITETDLAKILEVLPKLLKRALVA